MRHRARWTLLAAILPLVFGAATSTADAQDALDARQEKTKKIVFIHGGPSHGRGAHEYRAGCMLIEAALKKQVPGLRTELHRDWPKDPSTLENADSVVIFSSGGGHHPVVRRLEEFDKIMDRGIGFVALHYAVEVPKGDPGKAMLKWLGGYFEPHWSVNPHWEAEFTVATGHPTTYGVGKLKSNDEWYYHMRFQENLKGVTPILSAVPPASTLTRKDGAHSGNPHVRKAVASGEPQHVAWAYERDNGGRSFGFTGLHFHRNFENDAYRTLLLNAVLWSTGAAVPKGGIPSATPSKADLESNLD